MAQEFIDLASLLASQRTPDVRRYASLACSLGVDACYRLASFQGMQQSATSLARAGVTPLSSGPPAKGGLPAPMDQSLAKRPRPPTEAEQVRATPIAPRGPWPRPHHSQQPCWPPPWGIGGQQAAGLKPQGDSIRHQVEVGEGSAGKGVAGACGCSVQAKCVHAACLCFREKVPWIE
eukprot:scaffold13644_cov33-Tisochrysis_lutea.AAC.6